MFAQGMFQNSANMTPQQIERKRALMAALMPRFGSAKYVGEGLGQLATGVAMGRQGKQLDQRENSNRQEGDGLFQRILSGASSRQPQGNGGGFSILGQTPQQSRDPNSPGAIASDAMSAIGQKSPQGGDRESFIQAMMPHALRVSQQTGLDPRLVIAQSAQETGWGKSAPGNNFFGIKSHGKGGGNTMATNEVVNGQTVRINDSFRGYEDMGQSADDYARFLQENPRYKPMLAAGDLEGQIAALGQSGYATDPNYASSVRSIASSIQLPGGGMGEPQGQTQQTQQGGAIPLENLYSAMASPLLTDEQRSVITSMIQQRQQEADPMRALQMQGAELGLQKTQMEIEAMRNPKPDMTTTQREYDMARQQGYQGTFMDYKSELAAAGRAQTNITLDPNGNPRPELLGTQGLVAIPDPTVPEGYRVVPAPGSPIATEREQAAAANERKSASKSTEADVIITAAQRAREAASKRNFGPFGSATVGAVFPQSDSGEVIRQVSTLKANGTFSALQQMRDNSPTGAALGAASDRDLQLLAEKAGSLDPSSPNLQRDLDDYERTLLRTLYGPEEGDMMFNQSRQGAPSTDNPGVPTFEDDAAYLRSLGLEP